MNPLGTHFQVWVGSWDPDEIRPAAEKAAEIGYDFLELPVRAPETVNAEAIARILENNGMFCTASFIHTLETDIASEDSDIVAKGEALMYEALAKARDIGSTRLVGGFHSSLKKHDTARTEGGRRNAVNVLRRVAERAAEMGVVMCLEPLNRYESNLINTGEQALEMIGEIGSDNMFVHLDSFHMNIEEASPANAIRDCGDRLGYLHLAENFRGYLGTGSIDFASIFKACSDIGYDGPIALEVFSSAVVDPAHSARLAIWREVWSDSEDMASHALKFMRSGIEAAQDG
ncbi:MAG: sugar phosphate isomerase/epimerase [Rhodospirillales bacterium]|jgi:D-psicose/D-tagatose/L-ribulose 3-epimerase|nr:sugar phosphate isomerase/epimerase [Rhodospirillales bacterium]